MHGMRVLFLSHGIVMSPLSFSSLLFCEFEILTIHLYSFLLLSLYQVLCQPMHAGAPPVFGEFPHFPTSWSQCWVALALRSFFLPLKINILPCWFSLLFLLLPFGTIHRVLVISCSFQEGGDGEGNSGWEDLRQAQLTELFPVCPVL